MSESKIGILLINLGTPASPEVKDVRRFLREFLTDPCVIDLPWLLRQSIVNFLILPFRPKNTAKLYQKIWTSAGSPLLCYSQEFSEKLADLLGEQYVVALGMRYGNPSLTSAITKLVTCQKIIIFPLFPQYSRAATQTAIMAAEKVIAKVSPISSVTTIKHFFDNSLYIEAMAAKLQQAKPTEFVLFSYHGLPERALLKSGCKKSNCDRIHSCLLQKPEIEHCYRAQCFATSAAIAAKLGLGAQTYATVFQSRLGRAAWIQPYAEEYLTKLAAQGIKHLSVVCPSFVADCLETLEEINIRMRQQWMALGGETFSMVSCLNADPDWVSAAAGILTSSISAC